MGYPSLLESIEDRKQESLQKNKQGDATLVKRDARIESDRYVEIRNAFRSLRDQSPEFSAAIAELQEKVEQLYEETENSLLLNKDLLERERQRSIVLSNKIEALESGKHPATSAQSKKTPKIIVRRAHKTRDQKRKKIWRIATKR